MDVIAYRDIVVCVAEIERIKADIAGMKACNIDHVNNHGCVGYGEEFFTEKAQQIETVIKEMKAIVIMEE